MKERRDILPISLPPRGINREEAARYVGVSPALFDQMVADGRMPGPKQVNARTIWDRVKLDLAFDGLPERETPPQNPQLQGWDDFK